MCDRVAVMYAGRIVEMGDVREIFNNPSHPLHRGPVVIRPPSWKRTLIASIPSKGNRRRSTTCRRAAPSRPRCQYVMDKCLETYPSQFDVTDSH